MNTIAKLDDKAVLGKDGISVAKPRYTSRAILRNSKGLYAVMYAERFNLYSLVGGGIDNNETPIEALKREVLEETGCSCDEIDKLGIVSENRYHADYTQISYYFVVTTNGVVKEPDLTADEKQNKTTLEWHTFDELYNLISNPVHKTNQQKFLQARDVAALDYYIKRK